MNREETRKAAEIMLAYVDGAEIEVKYSGFSKWRKFIDDVEPLFNWDAANYRIKPKPREFLINLVTLAVMPIDTDPVKAGRHIKILSQIPFECCASKPVALAPLRQSAFNTGMLRTNDNCLNHSPKCTGSYSSR